MIVRCATPEESNINIIWTKLDATSELLTKLTIEEYPTRIRAHRWLAPDSDTEIAYVRYDFSDVAISPALNWRISDGRGVVLWAYSTDGMAGALKLSGSWEWDTNKKRAFFQLTLWLDRELRETQQIPPADIIFKIPLDPGRLCDEQGQTVYVGGVERKAGEVEPFPFDVENWKYECGEGSDWRWSWYMGMQTFNSGLSNRGLASDFLFG